MSGAHAFIVYPLCLRTPQSVLRHLPLQALRAEGERVMTKLRKALVRPDPSGAKKEKAETMFPPF